MKKEEYINNIHKNIKESFSQDQYIKIVFHDKSRKEEFANCYKCKNDKFYWYNKSIICSKCFNEHSYNWDYCSIKILDSK